ncbi:MAG: anti-sigma factor antagonist [Caldilineaceae bacterium]|nr:anti-sigma factor antagonist [Caldilineaceae bacterium]
MSIALRRPSATTAILDIKGDVNGYAEDVLMDAYTEASNAGAKVIGLNFTDLEYMNSSGIGLLVTLLIRVQRNKQRLMAFGLSDHYCQIFQLTRLDEAISIFGTEQEALASAALK